VTSEIMQDWIETVFNQQMKEKANGKLRVLFWMDILPTRHFRSLISVMSKALS